MYLQLRSIKSIDISARQKSWLSKEYITYTEFYADSKNITLDSQLFEFVELQTTKVKKYEPMREQDNIIKHRYWCTQATTGGWHVWLVHTILDRSQYSVRADPNRSSFHKLNVFFGKLNFKCYNIWKSSICRRTAIWQIEQNVVIQKYKNLHKLNSEPVHSLTYDVSQIELFHFIIRDQIRSSRLSSLPFLLPAHSYFAAHQ